MRILKVLFAIACTFALTAPASAVLLTTPTQTGLPEPLTFTFSGVAPASGNATFSIFAQGDLGYDTNEYLNIFIGTSGGSLTDYGNYFNTISGFTSYTCDGYACISGTVDIVLSALDFNAFGPNIDVLLVSGDGVNSYQVNGANVSLSYDAAAVPEPMSTALVGLGLAAMAVARRRRKA